MTRLCDMMEKKAAPLWRWAVLRITAALVDKRMLVIQGDVSVCIEGSMQPQRPRRISLRGTTWRLLSNYKPTQTLDKHKGQGCILTMNSQECFLLPSQPTLNYIQHVRWHTHDIHAMTITWRPLNSNWCRNNGCTCVYPTSDVCVQLLSLYAGSLPVLVLCCRLCPGCFSYSGLSWYDLRAHARIQAVSNESRVPAVYLKNRNRWKKQNEGSVFH